MAPDPEYPLPYQFLGDSGTTFPCLKAMVAILTSPYRPRSITAVFRDRPPGQRTTDVCFVVWDWLGHKATIVSDGFGTHHGEGGRGFAAVCDLIELYEIPLQEHEAGDAQFERIAYGYPTEQDLEQLRHAGPASYYHLRSLARDFGRQLWQDEPPRFNTPVPYWVMEPELLGDLKDIQRSPGSAVFQVARRLEMLMRDAAGLPAMVSGELLIHTALGQHKPLEMKGTTAHETESWVHLFLGVLGAFKEPLNHHDQPLGLEDAIAQILTINLLLRKLKQDHPERFQDRRP
jgi:hypothetical protein